MKDILLLLVLLNAQITKVCSQPYKPDSDGACRDPRAEYLSDVSNLCCKKCQPGERLKEECSETTDTVCDQCPPGQYKESRNYSPTCFSCDKCKASKGLQYGQNCSSTTRSKCVCQPNWFCVMEFDDPYCKACNKYTRCRVGYGVSQPGTANSDVKCERCPDGTFSDTVSHTDPCRPHTDCHGRAVVKKGNATSDTMCAAEAFISNPISAKEPHTETVITTASTTISTAFTTSDSETPRGLTDSAPPISQTSPVSEVVFNLSTKSPPVSDSTPALLAAITAGVIGLLLFIGIILVCLCKCKKDAVSFQPKVDANGNCERGDKINQGYLSETQLTSFTVTAPEQQCLLEKGEACSDQSQCSNNTETSTRTDGCSSHESISPFQSTMALGNSHSALSEPMTLLSYTEPVSPQPSIPTQSSSQPTSPQIITPVTPSPHVNVNITFHIGNGSGGTPSVLPTDLMQVDPKLPFGEEEESFSIPQQEAGKQSLVSVQESQSFSEDSSA